MSDKILYTGGPNFKGLIGMPERPKRSDFESSEIGQQGFERSLIHYSEFVESIKSNAPDIVNPELIPLQIEECDLCDGCGWYEGGPTLKTTCNNCFGTGSVIHHYFSHVKVIPGDIFDLPVGYEFKKQPKAQFDDNGNWLMNVDVLRIVKTESGLRNGLNEPVETREQPDSLVKTEVKEPPILMRWVKAVDRLPQHLIKLNVKIDGNPYGGRYDHTLKRFMCPNMGPQGISVERIEWLEELSQPEPEESQKEEPYLKLSRNEYGKAWLLYKPLKDEPGKYTCWEPISEEFYAEFEKLIQRKK